MTLPSNTVVNKLIRKWQRRLRLAGWDIGWSWVSQEVVDKAIGTGGAVAYNEYSIALHRAWIRLVDSVHWGEGHLLGDDDLELTVIHELAHVRTHHAERLLVRISDLIGQRLAVVERGPVEDLIAEVREHYVETIAGIAKEAHTWKS